MNKKRLLKLADLLEADAENPAGARFDLGTWAWSEGNDRFPTPRSFKRLDCNTQACAVGIACLSGAFKDEGLRWRSLGDENNIIPLFDGWDGFEAVEAFFSITHDESHFLFVNHKYRDLPTKGADGERVVANRIRDFVSGNVAA